MISARNSFGPCSKVSVNRDVLRVLVATPWFPSPAKPYAGSFVASQCTELMRQGVDMHVIRPLPWVPWLSHVFVPRWRSVVGTPRKYLWAGIEVITPRYCTLPRNLAHVYAARQIGNRLVQHIKGEKTIHLIHGHGTLPVGVAAVQAGTKLGIPVILTVHGTDINRYPFLSKKYMQVIREALRSSVLVLAVSEDLALKVAAIEPSLRVRVHRIGVDLAAFDKRAGAAFDRTTSRDQQQFRIVYVGRLVKAKGVHDLFEAYKMFLSVWGHLDSRLMFVGDGVEASSLRTACERSDILRGRVRFTGSVPNNRVPAILAEADVVVLPSYSEGLPLVLVEAMAAGLPCIGTRVGGIPEVIIDGYNGILVDPGSPAQIANALGLLVSNEEFRASLARAARDSVETKYDIKRNSLALIELYREVIQP